MNLLFLSGVEIPDPEEIVMEAANSMGIPIPSLPDLLSYPEMPGVPNPRIVKPTEDPPEDYVIPEAGPSGEDDGGDEDHGIRWFD